MALFRLRYTISPSAPFGLPDGSRIVLPAGPREIVSPSIDTHTGKIASHGTLPEYRRDDQKLCVAISDLSCGISFIDNFLTVELDASDPAAAYFKSADIVDTLMQTLSVEHGVRFAASFGSAENEKGEIQRVPRPFTISLLDVSTYNIEELAGRIAKAFHWSRNLDQRARKAIMYYEHAQLLGEHAQTLEFPSPHAASSRALAFLQLFKAITTILGEPGTDRDYQRRFRELGLPSDFWTDRVAPLYKVRNDEDVAHYRLANEAAQDFLQMFGAAGQVFKEAFGAYMTKISPNNE